MISMVPFSNWSSDPNLVSYSTGTPFSWMVTHRCSESEPLCDMGILSTVARGPVKPSPYTPTMPGAASEGVLAMLLALVNDLREAGIAVSMVEMLDAATALGHLDLLDRPVLRAGLAGTLVKRPEDLPIFQLAFDRCFAPTAPGERAEPAPAEPAPPGPEVAPVEPSP